MFSDLFFSVFVILFYCSCVIIFKYDTDLERIGWIRRHEKCVHVCAIASISKLWRKIAAVSGERPQTCQAVCWVSDVSSAHLIHRNIRCTCVNETNLLYGSSLKDTNHLRNGDRPMSRTGYACRNRHYHKKRKRTE